MTIEGEIKIEFPEATKAIRLISSDDIKAHFDRLDQNVPFTFVGLPYVEIDGKSYAVLPLSKDEKERIE